MKKFLLFFICLFLIPKTSDANWYNDITWYNDWGEAAKAAEGKGGKAIPCSPEGKYSLCYPSSSYCNPSSNCYSCYYEKSSRCGSCPSGYTLSNGICFPTSDGPLPKCGAYKYGSCSSWYCEGDYTYTNGKCVKTVSCSGNYHPSKEVCESGNGVEKCDRSWVQPYQDNGCWVILRCKEGFGSNQQGQCVKTVSCSGRTPEKSIQADGSIKCSCNSTSCGANAKCIRHPKYNANTLQNNYSYCVCNSGYYDTGSSCAACPTNCTECSSGSVCTACAKGYELSSGKCVAQTNTVSTCPPYTTKSSDGCCCIPD